MVVLNLSLAVQMAMAPDQIMVHEHTYHHIWQIEAGHCPHGYVPFYKQPARHHPVISDFLAAGRGRFRDTESDSDFTIDSDSDSDLNPEPTPEQEAQLALKLCPICEDRPPFATKQKAQFHLTSAHSIGNFRRAERRDEHRPHGLVQCCFPLSSSSRCLTTQRMPYCPSHRSKVEKVIGKAAFTSLKAAGKLNSECSTDTHLETTKEAAYDTYTSICSLTFWPVRWATCPGVNVDNNFSRCDRPVDPKLGFCLPCSNTRHVYVNDETTPLPENLINDMLLEIRKGIVDSNCQGLARTLSNQVHKCILDIARGNAMEIQSRQMHHMVDMMSEDKLLRDQEASFEDQRKCLLAAAQRSGFSLDFLASGSRSTNFLQLTAPSASAPPISQGGVVVEEEGTSQAQQTEAAIADDIQSPADPPATAASSPPVSSPPTTRKRAAEASPKATPGRGRGRGRGRAARS